MKKVGKSHRCVLDRNRSDITDIEMECQSRNTPEDNKDALVEKLVKKMNSL